MWGVSNMPPLWKGRSTPTPGGHSWQVENHWTRSRSPSFLKIFLVLSTLWAWMTPGPTHSDGQCHNVSCLHKDCMTAGPELTFCERLALHSVASDECQPTDSPGPHATPRSNPSNSLASQNSTHTEFPCWALLVPPPGQPLPKSWQFFRHHLVP